MHRCPQIIDLLSANFLIAGPGSWALPVSSPGPRVTRDRANTFQGLARLIMRNNSPRIGSGAVCIRMRAFPSTALGTRRHESARPDGSLRNERLLGDDMQTAPLPRIVS